MWKDSIPTKTRINQFSWRIFLKGLVKDGAKECLTSYLTESFKQELKVDVISVDQLLNSKVKWNVFESYKDK